MRLSDIQAFRDENYPWLSKMECAGLELVARFVRFFIEAAVSNGKFKNVLSSLWRSARRCFPGDQSVSPECLDGDVSGGTTHSSRRSR